MSLLILLDFAPPRPSPSSLLLLSSKAGEVLGLTPSNWGYGAAEVLSTCSSVCPAFVLLMRRRKHELASVDEGH